MRQARHEAFRYRSTVCHSGSLEFTNEAWCTLRSSRGTCGSRIAMDSTTGSGGLGDGCTALNLLGQHDIRSAPGDTWSSRPYRASAQRHVRRSSRIHPPPISLKPRLASKPETHSHHLEYGAGNF